MESCSNQKGIKQIKIYFIFEILQPFALMTALHTLGFFLNQLHLECFPNSLEGVATYAEHLAAFPSLCGPTHPKPPQLG